MLFDAVSTTAFAFAFWMPGPWELAIFAQLLVLIGGFILLAFALRPSRRIAASVWATVRTGWTEEQVRAALGAPDRITLRAVLGTQVSDWQYGRWPAKD